MDDERLVVENEISIDYNKLTPSSLEMLLDEELSIDDIKQYQQDILKSLKDLKNSECKKYNCKMTDIILKEIVIINSILDWIIILEEEQGLG